MENKLGHKPLTKRNTSEQPVCVCSSCYMRLVEETKRNTYEQPVCICSSCHIRDYEQPVSFNHARLAVDEEEHMNSHCVCICSTCNVRQVLDKGYLLYKCTHISALRVFVQAAVGSMCVSVKHYSSTMAITNKGGRGGWKFSVQVHLRDKTLTPNELNTRLPFNMQASRLMSVWKLF